MSKENRILMMLYQSNESKTIRIKCLNTRTVVWFLYMHCAQVFVVVVVVVVELPPIANQYTFYIFACADS